MIKSREKALWEYQEAMAEQREEGREEGIVIGEERERKKAFQEKIESAKKLLMKGLKLSDIADALDLSPSEVQSLKAQ